MPSILAGAAPAPPRPISSGWSPPPVAWFDAPPEGSLKAPPAWDVPPVPFAGVPPIAASPPEPPPALRPPDALALPLPPEEAPAPLPPLAGTARSPSIPTCPPQAPAIPTVNKQPQLHEKQRRIHQQNTAIPFGRPVPSQHRHSNRGHGPRTPEFSGRNGSAAQADQAEPPEAIESPGDKLTIGGFRTARVDPRHLRLRNGPSATSSSGSWKWEQLCQ